MWLLLCCRNALLLFGVHLETSPCRSLIFVMMACVQDFRKGNGGLFQQKKCFLSARAAGKQTPVWQGARDLQL